MGVPHPYPRGLAGCWGCRLLGTKMRIMQLPQAQTPKPLQSVLFVCMGNICRSPSAHGVFRDKLRAHGLEHLVKVDSAGTHSYHRGEPPDPRSQRHAAARGYDLSDLRSRPLHEDDFKRFDLILVMDWDNLALTQQRCPKPEEHKIRRLSEFSQRHNSTVIPDPYSGGTDGFERVLDLIEDACDGLLRHIQNKQRAD